MNGLIEDIKQGDRAAFRELFEDYYPILCVFAMPLHCHGMGAQGTNKRANRSMNILSKKL